MRELQAKGNGVEHAKSHDVEHAKSRDVERAKSHGVEHAKTLLANRPGVSFTQNFFVMFNRFA